MKSNEIVVIDVRTKEELDNHGMIPGTFNVPLQDIKDEGAFELPDNEFQAKYGLKKPKKKDSFVLSCRSGKRILVAQNILRKLGYKDIRMYFGSFNDWKKKGGEISKAQ